MIEVFQNKNCNLFKDTVINYNENSYIVSIDGNIIGHFNVILIDDTYSIEYELLKEFRGIGLSNYFLHIIEKYVIDNFDTNRILLMIKYNNSASLKLAQENGYHVDYDLYEETMQEDSSYIPYIKEKEYSLKKSLI